jgi:hypothetical protein
VVDIWQVPLEYVTIKKQLSPEGKVWVDAEIFASTAR